MSYNNNKNCEACDIDYNLKSSIASDSNMSDRYCPYCGEELIKPLDLDEKDLMYTNADYD
jgi:predicted RNA-binding Zn-ribbon protein involved in translation (DUF1610 family)